MRRAARAIVVRGDKMLVMHRNKFGSEYYTLVGGGVQGGEDGERALGRELMEETGFRLVNAKPVFIEKPGDPYGDQYIYLCEVEGDEPKLAPNSAEAEIFHLGNLHTPMWLPLSDLPQVAFRSEDLKQAILYGVEHGFPASPVTLDRQYLDAVQSNIARKGGWNGSKA